MRAEWGGSGTTTSNGDGGDSGAGGSINSSATSSSSIEETKFHEVQQYHYLIWKDFVAPEHPVGILSFLRRINEAYSHDQGPLLIHCR